MSLFEAHITCDMADDEDCAKLATEVAVKYHWKTSEIARDPVLGEKTYFYLTSHSPSFESLKSRMESAVAALRQYGVNVVREKIEHIVYDTKVGINEMVLRGQQVNSDEYGCAIIEWWHGDKKLTLYGVGHPLEALLKRWGPPLFEQTEYVSVMDAQKVSEAFEWLAKIPENKINDAR